ncbi:MAG: xanthine dehydrogenase family protein subunit M [Proteobacteria bacterium]|nr:xanthine dehydrogenase family protein subunit M [Pseudomonadota bacterium]
MLLLPPFDYHAPASLEEVIDLLETHGQRARVLAGGTDLLVNMKRGFEAPDCVVDLGRVPGLDVVKTTRTATLIGAGATARTLSENRALGRRLPALAQAAAQLGSPLIRNRATLGGNLAHARPAADLAPPLLAAGASVVLRGPGGERVVDLSDFFIEPGRTCLGPDEVLVRFVIPASGPGTGEAFVKLGLRRALERSIVSVAARIVLSEDGRRIESARIALGAVAPTPLRSPCAEQALTGASADTGSIDQAAREACRDACPRGRCSSTEYSLMMVEVMTRRALTRALNAARQ